MKGYVHAYTGAGKGKTTAALGLAMRAAGAGLRVFIGQYLKRGDYSEIKILKQRFPEIPVRHYGSGRFVRGRPDAADTRRAGKGLGELVRAMTCREYDVVIADEIFPAIRAGVLSARDADALLDARPRNVELVLTGRNAPASILRRCDLVTEMRCVRHYMDIGAKARKGMEM